MRFILNLILNPLFILVFLVCVALIVRRYHKRLASLIFLVTASAWFFLIAISPLPIFLAKQLEYRYPVLDQADLAVDTQNTTHIVVLGGGLAVGEGVTHADQLSGDALSRIVEGVRLYHLIPGAKIVTSGFSLRGPRSQADILASVAVDLGVNPADTMWLPMPTNTREEAAHYRSRFGDSARIILVTSAIHLPRAVGWFQYQGLDSKPAPANHVVKFSPDKWTYNWWPAYKKVTLMGKVVHEYAGQAELGWMSRR